jgi:hypothetical protein
MRVRKFGPPQRNIRNRENSVRKLINSVIPTANYLLSSRRRFAKRRTGSGTLRVLQINALCYLFYDVARSQ